MLKINASRSSKWFVQIILYNVGTESKIELNRTLIKSSVFDRRFRTSVIKCRVVRGVIFSPKVYFYNFVEEMKKNYLNSDQGKMPQNRRAHRMRQNQGSRQHCQPKSTTIHYFRPPCRFEVARLCTPCISDFHFKFAKR